MAPVGFDDSPLAAWSEMTQRVGMVGIVSTIVALLVAILSVVLPPVNPDQLSTLPIVVVVSLVISAIVFFLIVPRGERSNRPAVPGLVCSIIGLVLVFPAFWSGLPIVLGAGGSVLGQAGRGGRQSTGGGLALGAIIVGIAAIVLNLLALLFDRLAS